MYIEIIISDTRGEEDKEQSKEKGVRKEEEEGVGGGEREREREGERGCALYETGRNGTRRGKEREYDSRKLKIEKPGGERERAQW